VDIDRVVLFVIMYCGYWEFDSFYGRIKINTSNATDTANILHVARRHIKSQFLFPFPTTRFINMCSHTWAKMHIVDRRRWRNIKIVLCWESKGKWIGWIRQIISQPWRWRQRMFASHLSMEVYVTTLGIMPAVKTSITMSRVWSGGRGRYHQPFREFPLRYSSYH